MKRMTHIIALGLLAAFCVSAQKLEIQSLDSTKITRVETATDHLTVIEVSSPVTMVAVGNQGAFSVERRDNKVFVKPVEQGAKTNLIVWTTAGRFAYELVPASSVEQMHFVVNQAPTPVAANLPTPAKKAATPPSLPAEMLTKANPILLTGDRETQGRVEIALRDMYRERNRIYVRYAVINHSSREYQPARPAAWRLAGVRSAQSLIPLGGHQLGERLVRSLKAASSVRLDVREAADVATVAAGGHRLGWLVIEEPVETDIDVSALKLKFAADTKGPVEAVMVLGTRSDRQEVVNARPAGE